MRVLVLGGTVFLGKAVAAEAVRRGHEVVCAARGTSGTVPEGATLVAIDRDAPDGLAPLRGERFDAVVDVATMSVNWVREALRELGDNAGHWTFVSTCSVYADQGTPGQTVDSPLLPPLEDDTEIEERGAKYGGIKVSSERAVRDALGDKAFIVRAGLICGPGDLSDRFGYWPARISQGGRVLVPDTADQPTQIIDARDLAAWILTAAERGVTGTFDGSSPARPLGEFLAEIAEAVAPEGTELVPMTKEELVEAEVQGWVGPRSLPVWVMSIEGYEAMMDRDAGPSLAAGLTVRPLAETARDSLAYERELGLDRERRAGLTLEEEAKLLAAQ
ncbi:epimerase [Solihabitans fulvus]|uniref:Epimerase n=1 Tax=Solihabitans fulvus TaxID=1892852 RepID=A0A5B2XBF3_9PSEU|nr:NAD-dependent epimerase/dehydratase family protein [Solihabitans fulvus]KAA2260112.1 epimerase [Solihabitans fulvus]